MSRVAVFHRTVAVAVTLWVITMVLVGLAVGCGTAGVPSPHFLALVLFLGGAFLLGFVLGVTMTKLGAREQREQLT